MSLNQAVIFTKPVHHLELELTPEQLDEMARSFFESKGFSFILNRKISGTDLAARNVIREHYLMYSRAACADVITVTEEAKDRFEAAFGKTWDAEFSAGKIMSTTALLKTRNLSVHQLFNRWNGLFGAGKTTKIQDGVIMGYLEDLDAYCVNAFYPSMEANFYHPDTRISYYVVEFDSEQVSWKQFRKEVLGATNSSNALPESFRGQLYSEYPTNFPGRDNFVHGSAGPFEGFVERAIHEPDFDMRTNPIGLFLAEKGVTLDAFRDWKSRETTSQLGQLFDETEEKNTDEIFQTLEKIQW
jgi:nucleoside diphosphate kinase